MKKVIEAFGTGVSAEEALLNAEKELSAPESVEISKEVVDVQEKKILGIFKSGTIYKARAYYEIDEPEKKSAPKTESKKSPKQESKKTVEAPKKQESAEEKKLPDAVEENGPVQDYLKNILNGLMIENAKILTQKDDESISFQIECGDDYGCVIGRRGETLDAIQYLTRLVVNKGDIDYKRVSVNVGDYREKRANTLTELAKKNASKVIKYGRNVVLEPMNPYERRVIHTAVQNIENVESYSIGSDDNRRVVIKLCDGVKPTNPGSSRGGRNGGNRRNNYSSKRNDEVKANTTPKSDALGASLYGKIEPKAKIEATEE